MTARRGRRRANPFARIVGVLVWVVVAVAIATIVLVATGRTLAASLGITIACGFITIAVIGVLDVTGVLRITEYSEPPGPDESGARGTDENEPPVG